jgi:hypothetical protein
VRHLTLTVGEFVRSEVVKHERGLTMGFDIRHAKRLLTLTAAGLILAAGLLVVSGAATAARSHAPAHRIQAFWTRCDRHVTMSGFEISPVEVLHTTCARAGRAIERGRVLDTPGGPMFWTRGYACRSRAILPPVDPSPASLPAAEFCRQGTRQLSFVWDYAS